jgi:hypothetical protein
MEDYRLTKRSFLKTVAAGTPSLRLLAAAQAAASVEASGKCTPLDCSKHFHASAADVGPVEEAGHLSAESARDKLIRTPSGRQVYRGIPFLLGPEGTDAKKWIALSLARKAWSAERVEIPIGSKASFLCLAQFCNWDENESPPPGKSVIERVGQPLAEAVMVYEDGSEHRSLIRRRFEAGALSYPWGHLCFAAAPHRSHAPLQLTDSVRNAMDWGEQQTAALDASYPSGESASQWQGTLWICALENPNPDRGLRSLRLAAKADDPLFVCGLTLYHGRENPLRYERLTLYRIRLPKESGDWEVKVDLGVVARTYSLPRFDSKAWLMSALKSLAERNPDSEAGFLYAEVSASPDATLVLRDKDSRRAFEFELGQASADRELEARRPGARIQLLEKHKVWLHGTVVDSTTGRPAPVRLAFRSNDGRYIPPYGHRTEINAGWFQDYGADLKWADSSFAYVDGTFQAELPTGEVHVEISKGFEYEPVRRKLHIAADQRELRLEISRLAEVRSKGWVSADTHVHFLSPSTAVLEGQAEGLNLVNLLAAQWADLFTNVGDLAYGPLRSSDGETEVRVSTENRQHILGHLALLRGRGEPVYPMSAGGPSESYIGDPVWNTLAEWADRCREGDGLVVSVHFPYPTAELAALVALGKIDAVEMYPTGMSEHFNNLRFLEWYRYLNCGYRLPAVSGTDKMGAWIPVGAQRVYAHLGQEEFTFANWTKAVRGGNTFMTSGPLLMFQADGKPPGAEIALGAGGGTVEAAAEVTSAFPIHRLEIVRNGEVVAAEEDKEGARTMRLRSQIRVDGPGWLAARCASRLLSAWIRIAAHTSPVYLTVPGKELFSAETAAYMLTLIDGSETWVKSLATRPDAERYARVLKTLADARERVHRRMHEHGVKH